ncbi:MAG: ExsB family transcriptional regulator [Actinobacteria bacterium]|nr:MAG: ExsB family transcriptional regulator [Actinomycetota bacterium]
MELSRALPVEPCADELLRRVADLVGETATAAVAFSGGADSALALAACSRALGPERTIAVTAVSPSLPPTELTHAKATAAALGVEHLTPDSNELARPGYADNSPSRCFHCKTEVIEVVFRAVVSVDSASRGGGRQPIVVTGTNADDLASPYRPGIAAAARLGAVTPLAELTKAQVRAVSKYWGLPTWDKPAQACLASRIAYGVTVSADSLLRVQRAEAALRTEIGRLGWSVRDLRVRDLGQDRARIELDADLTAALAEQPRASAVVLAAGFDEVEFDPRGFRSGSMNEALTSVEAIGGKGG